MITEQNEYLINLNLEQALKKSFREDCDLLDRAALLLREILNWFHDSKAPVSLFEHEMRYCLLLVDSLNDFAERIFSDRYFMKYQLRDNRNLKDKPGFIYTQCLDVTISSHGPRDNMKIITEIPENFEDLAYLITNEYGQDPMADFKYVKNENEVIITFSTQINEECEDDLEFMDDL